MRFVILGPTELHVSRRKVDLGPAKQRGLLTLLCYHLGKPVSTDVIIDEFWPGESREAVRNRLYQLVSRIRAVLRRNAVPGTLSATIEGYRLDLDPELVDFHRFTRLVQESEAATNAGDHTAAAHLLTEAIGLWRGTPLADLQGHWSSRRRQHMTDVLWLGAHKRLFDALLALGEYQTVLARMDPLFEEHDLDETIAGQRMTALDGAGRGAAVTPFYLDFRRRWMREQGSEPGREVNDAYRRIVNRRHQPEPHLPPRYPLRDIHDFTGHEELLAKLDAILTGPGSAGGVVAIDGMPGIGKTTLARHWAHQHRELFPGGQEELDLRAYGPTPPIGTHDALGRLLSALGAHGDLMPFGEDQRRQRLSQLLDGRRILILLDNAYDAAQVRPLLSATADCAVLITSRTRLKGLTIREGVHSITMPPLGPEESASLLKGMIGTGRAESEHDALLALADLSGGLPLALRIIGQHAAERPRARLFDLVEQIRRYLLAPGHGTDDEDASVRAAFTYSYRALQGQAARMFRLLSLHPGVSVSVGAAAALCDVDNIGAEDLLERLARANLLEHDSVGRYRFHDLLRSFAADCTRGEETAEQRHQAIERMLDWYLLSATNAAVQLAPQRTPVPDLPTADRVEPITFEDDTAAMRWCREERGNLTAATRCAAEHGFHNRAWQIPGAVHEVFERYGCQDDVLECNETALASARKIGHLVGVLGTLNNLGVAFHSFRNYDRATVLYQEGIQLAGALNHRMAQATLMHNLGNINVKRGNFTAALDLYQQALRISRDVENLPCVAYSLHRLGKAYRHMGRHAESLGHHREALAIRERIGHLRGQGATHAELAALHLATGDFPLALRHAELALELSRKTMDQVTWCDALITRATARRQQGHTAPAIKDLRRVAETCLETGDSGRRVRALDALAEALVASGEPEQARKVWTEELRTLDPSDTRARRIRNRLASPVATSGSGSPHSSSS